jgi:hypothetical protein
MVGSLQCRRFQAGHVATRTPHGNTRFLAHVPAALLRHRTNPAGKWFWLHTGRDHLDPRQLHARGALFSRSSNENRSRIRSATSCGTLTRNKNSEASNYDFPKKRDGYFSGKKGVTNYAITVSVLAHKTDWTPTVIQQRQSEYLGRLATLWRLA